MELGSIFLIFALLVLVALYVTQPFFERRNTSMGIAIESQEHDRSALLAERDRILNALHELDFDHTLGKIPEEDYPTQRSSLLEMGSQVLRKLDDLTIDSEDKDWESRLETEITARRLAKLHLFDTDLSSPSQNDTHQAVKGISTAVAAPDDELEVLLADRRRDRREKSAGFCPKCGNPVQKKDRFCPKCGAGLN
jgi:hypothetical protein